MDTSSQSSSKRTGTPGIDIFKLAGESVSGWIHSFKTGNSSCVRLPYMSKLEQRLALYLEYHPHVRSYQRGDASEAFAKAYRLVTPLGTPYRINYTYEDNQHEYLPDYVGTLCDGKLLIAEAGIENEKLKGKPLAKAHAAHSLAQMKGGVYWIGTEKNLSLSRHWNLVYLHARRDPFKTYKDIAPILLAHWPWGEHHTVRDFLRLLSAYWSEAEVEAAVWKMAGDAAAEGRLLVDLTEVELTLSTPLALLEPGTPPILPDPLPSSLEAIESTDSEQVSLVVEDRDAFFMVAENMIPGSTFDASSLDTEKERKAFNRNLAAVMSYMSGNTLPKVAETFNISVGTLHRLIQRTNELGQIACVPYGTYHRDRVLRPEFQQLIRKLYTHSLRPTVRSIAEDVRLVKLADELSKREDTLVTVPTYRQVWSFVNAISHEMRVIEARSGLKHHPKERMSPNSFVLSIPFPGVLCQVDEHTLDLFVVAQDGTVITSRVHGAVLICVKTAAILGSVLSLDSLNEEDYMRLIKQAMEPKERLVNLYGCQNAWPCSGKPAIIFHDRGKIFTSERATQVLVDRFNIITEQAPPYAPSAKGTVEALFTWTTRKFEHRLPGTTKATPKDRGAYDSVREAEKAGITLDLLEKYFIQAIVDDYMQDVNKLRRQKPSVLWESAVKTNGIPRWLGSQDDLKLLLMKAVNRKNPSTGRYALKPGQGLFFLGRRYVNEALLNRLRGKEIDIYYDRRDIRVIYLFFGGELVGEAYCPEFMGRRTSIWEAKALRKSDTVLAKEAATGSLESRQRLQENAGAGRRIHSLEAKQLEKRRQLDLQQQDIHPASIQATLDALSQQMMAPPLPKVQRLGILPSAEPEDDLAEVAESHLPIRRWKDREVNGE